MIVNNRRLTSSHEIEFSEQFRAAGNDFRFIPRPPRDADGGMPSSSDSSHPRWTPRLRRRRSRTRIRRTWRQRSTEASQRARQPQPNHNRQPTQPHRLRHKPHRRRRPLDPLRTRPLTRHAQQPHPLFPADKPVEIDLAEEWRRLGPAVQTGCYFKPWPGLASPGVQRTPHTVWVAQGSPQDPTEQQLEEVRGRMGLEQFEPERELVVSSDSSELALTLPNQSVSLLVLRHVEAE